MPTRNHYEEKLMKAVLEKSVADDFENARQEWEVYRYYDLGDRQFFDPVTGDPIGSMACTCGKDGLRYLWSLYNRLNGEKLFPIGSSCIKKFGREDLDKDAETAQRISRLWDFMRSLPTNQPFPFRSGEPYWQPGILDPEVIKMLHKNHLLDPPDALGVVIGPTADGVARVLYACVGSEAPDRETLEYGRMFMAGRVCWHLENRDRL